MQQPLEERVASLETASVRHEQTLARLDAIIANQDHLLERLVANQESLHANQQAMDRLLERLVANQETFTDNQQAMAQLLEELTRDAATTRRLWLRLAQRYGWLDDEQNGAQPQDPA